MKNYHKIRASQRRLYNQRLKRKQKDFTNEGLIFLIGGLTYLTVLILSPFLN